MLHDRIKQLCSRDGITITELERMLRIGNGTIHNWDTKNPTLGKVIMVAKHFGVGLIISYQMKNFLQKKLWK